MIDSMIEGTIELQYMALIQRRLMHASASFSAGLANLNRQVGGDDQDQQYFQHDDY